MGKRKAIRVDVRSVVLHEAGYRCGNPVCRHVITLDMHHLVEFAAGGPDTADNLLALCPNCHSLYHAGKIPLESLRAWKMFLLALNRAFDKHSIDVLLLLDKWRGNSLSGVFNVSGDGILQVAALAASDLVRVYLISRLDDRGAEEHSSYAIELSEAGVAFLQGWKQGDQSVIGRPV